MALIIYPATGWNSYVSLNDANTIAIDNILNLTSWNALTDAQKELYLKQSTTLIRLKIIDPLIADITLTEAPSDLKLATVHLSVSSIGVDMVDNDGKENIKRIKIDGALEKEFFTKGENSNAFPDIVSALLAQYQFVSSSSFSLVRS